MQSLRKLHRLEKVLMHVKNIRLRCESGGLYEPSYLQAMKSKIPLYEAVNIQLRGYDYPVLEHYQKFVHNMLKNMDVEVEDSWAVPAQNMDVTTLKPKSEIVHAKYNLKTYERVIQIADVSSIQLPIVIRAIEASLPAGVTAHFRQHEEADEEVRYIPDAELNTLKQELEDLGGPSKSRK
ncbi:39S ribosomal protein L48, mitochondrial [Diabrotica virgifera virgifera]|uniref:39S ribosomal protein L48, mitochondrial n=1 Tax=Diabrotica virgifera virgifera TaxID=50390 RepID=A0A6P7H139_DIAVI|nr:39S ribosomal protein L48, mitochondrial [Diabrotica virgifera virgifera]